MKVGARGVKAQMAEMEGCQKPVGFLPPHDLAAGHPGHRRSSSRPHI
jgi:hypothetical protein